MLLDVGLKPGRRLLNYKALVLFVISEDARF